MINIVCGRQGCGKTEFIMERIKQIPTDKNVFLVVPEQFTYENERMLFDRIGSNGMMHIQIVSLQRLAYRIGEVSPLQQKTVLTQEGKSLIVKRVMDEVLPSLHVFRGVGTKTGFMDEVMGLIDELKRNAVVTDGLHFAKETEKVHHLKEKLDDIETIYRAYEETLPSDYIDQQDYLMQCAVYAQRYEPFIGSEIYFDGFHSFDRSSAELITAMMRLADNVTFSLTYDESDPINFAVTADTFRLIEACAKDAGNETEMIMLCESHGQKKELRFLEEHLLGHEECHYADDSDAIELMEVTSIEQETELAASAILRYVKERGMRYRDIALVVSEPDRYAPVIEDVFYARGIPYFIDRRRSIIFSSPIRAFLFLVSMLKERIGGMDVIAFAKTGLSELTDDEIMLIENYALECGIKGSMWERSFARNNRDGYYDLIQLETIRQKLIRPIEMYRTLMKGCRTAKEFCEQTYQFWQEWGLKSRIEDYVQKFKDSGDYETANTYAQIYNKMILVLDQLYDLFADTEIETDGFHQMLAYAFLNAEVGIIPSTIDKVNVGDIVRTRAGDILALIVLGANEGSFPSVNSDGGILSEHEKLSLKGRGVDLIPCENYQRKKEQFLIYTLLAKPKEKLLIGRSSVDSQGEVLREAYLYERIRKMFPKATRIGAEEHGMDRILFSVTDESSALNELSGYLSKRKAGEITEIQEDRYFEAVYHVLKEEMPEKLAVIENGLDFTNEAQICDIEAYREALRMPLMTSISQLEKYAACPFRFFAEYLIRPEARREHELKHYDIGNILHRVMERYSNEILDGSIDAKTIGEAEIKHTVDRIAQEEIDRFASGFFAQIVRGNYLKEKLKRAALHAASEITRQLKLSDFLLTETEAKFHFKEQYQPICVEIEDVGKVYVQGKIDRIDTYEYGDETYVRIIDYKTGNKEFDLTKAYYGISLQLPVYMKVFTDAANASRAAGVFYFKIRSPMIRIDKHIDEEALTGMIRKEFALKGITLKDMEIIKAMDHEAEERSFISNVNVKRNGELRDNDSLIDPEMFAALLDHTTGQIAQLSKSIVEGDISIRPYRYQQQEKPCNWCQMQSICKFSESFCGNEYRTVRKHAASDIKAKLEPEQSERGEQ